jgi:NAD-dependent deacetylase
VTLDEQVRKAQGLLSQAQHAVALTGAGISTPSGIPDFRSPTSGLWQDVDPLQVASIFAFRQRPQDFYDWIHPLTAKTLAAQPNAAHAALANLEMHGPLQTVITQNIDMLHHKAGSQSVIEIHGHMRELTCLQCYDVVPSETILETFIETGDVPRCACGGILKPNVILFGEQLPVGALAESKRQARACDLMLVAGSSLEVAPAGDLPALATESEAHLIIVNYEETYADEMADVAIRADVVEILPRLAAPFLEQ